MHLLQILKTNLQVNIRPAQTRTAENPTKHHFLLSVYSRSDESHKGTHNFALEWFTLIHQSI